MVMTSPHTQSHTDAAQEHDLYVLTMKQLRARAKDGEDVKHEMEQEKRRHHNAQARLYRKEHPERTRAAVARCEGKRKAEKLQYLAQYRKDHPEACARAMRRYHARRQILREFMAIDESIFQ